MTTRLNIPPLAGEHAAATAASTPPAGSENIPRFNAAHDDRARRIAARLADSVTFSGGFWSLDREWPSGLLPAAVARDIEQLAAEYADEALRRDWRDDPDYQRDREYDDGREDW